MLDKNSVDDYYLVINGVFVILSLIQESILIGSMLGDGNLNLPKHGKNPRFLIKRKLEDKEYLWWEYEILKDFTTQEPIEETKLDHRTNKKYSSIYFYTRHLEIFKPYYEQWYNPKKIIPRDLKINDYILLIWFLDDGCITSKNGRLKIQLSTDGFPEDDVRWLADQVSLRYGEHFYRNRSNRILSADAGARKFLREIDKICPAHMSRKSDKWRKATNIWDDNIKLYPSSILHPAIKEQDFIAAIQSFGEKEFSTKNIAEKLQHFYIRNGKKVYYYDVILERLRKLADQQKIKIIDPGYKKPKRFINLI